MSKHRIFFDTRLDPGSVIELSGEQAHYLLNVLRLKPNSTVNLFNGGGEEYPCTVQRTAKKTIMLRVGKALITQTESPVKTWLVQSIARGERMDYCVQKATELGVHKIVPVFAERSNVKLDAERAKKRQAHWQKIAISASEQSGRVITPEVDSPCSLADFLQHQIPRSTTLIAMDLREGVTTLAAVPYVTGNTVLLFVGPEGGFDQFEIESLKDSGAVTLKLGNRVLRTETAGMIGLAAIQFQWGDFRT